RADRGGHEQRITFEVDFPEMGDDYEFLSQIWASRKIGYLLEQIRLNGETAELVDEVKRLAGKFGVVTPYTSYLAAPERELAAESPAPVSRDELMEEAGAGAVRAAEEVAQMKTEDRVVSRFGIETAAGMTFVLREDSVWVPTDYTDEETIAVAFGSDAYFWLADHFPVAEFLALGTEVIFPLDGQFIEITEAGGITDPQVLEEQLSVNGS
ncbi:MAG: hypothetical protein ACE5JP_18695, partial [Candidatus Bipolaricaulia bacterium]